MKDVADKHRAVVAAADDLQAVVAELNASHPVRVPPRTVPPSGHQRKVQKVTSAQCQSFVWALYT
jgi:hypothetical protein